MGDAIKLGVDKQDLTFIQGDGLIPTVGTNLP